MATNGGTVLTLSDWAKRVDPDGKIPKIVEMLSQTNEVLLDMQFKEGNLPTGHRTVVRTGLPAPAWRKLNGGVTPSKSTTAQIDEGCGMLEAFSEVDKDLAELNGSASAFRLSEAQAFIEGMNQEFVKTLFYGDTSVNPEKFLGLAPRFAGISGAVNAQNVIDAGGSGSDNTSVYLVVWGENTIHGIFPKGSKAGIVHQDLGLQVIENVAGIGGDRMMGYRDHWQWKAGIALKDWRYVVRIANIDVSDLAGSSGTQNAQQLIKLMSRALDRIPAFGMGKACFYANRTVASMLRVQALDKSQNAIAIEPALEQFGTPMKGGMSFMGIPIRRCDQLLSTEAQIT